MSDKIDVDRYKGTQMRNSMGQPDLPTLNASDTRRASVAPKKRCGVCGLILD